jgi:hypothetical protein
VQLVSSVDLPRCSRRSAVMMRYLQTMDAADLPKHLDTYTLIDNAADARAHVPIE